MTPTSTAPTSSLSYAIERQALVDASASLFRAGVMSHSGHANLSVRVAAETILLTTGGNVRALAPEHLAVVGLDGSVVEGSLEAANAEIVAMHTEVYRARPELGAIIHTHSPHLLAFALANRPLPDRYEALLRFGQAEEVPVAPWAPRGSERSVGAIVDLVKDRPDTMAVLLGNHGVLAFGANAGGAAALVVALEEAAEAEVRAAPLGGAVDFPVGALEEVRASMARVRR